MIKKFYQLSPKERLAQLVADHHLTQSAAETLAKQIIIDPKIADNLIENQISQYAIPQGIVTDVLIDATRYQVPMVTEEPSVVAAANHGNKIASLNGGVKTQIHSRLMQGEIVLTDLVDLKKATQWLEQHQTDIQQVANQAHPSILKRGGGLVNIEHEFLEGGFFKVVLSIDTKAAMGANIVNTICEAVGRYLQTVLGGNLLVSILTNAATTSLVSATVTIDPKTLATDEGLKIAQKIVRLSQLAQVDSQRAVTHNKGIMNGIDAVVIASGNDWRAIEASAHHYAVKSGQYQGLATWHVSDQQLIGRLELPMPIGIVGGSISVLPTVQINQQLMAIKTPEQLMSIIVAIGLLQNLAALKALVTDGIQKGHMSLQAKSLALASGASVAEVAKLMPKLLASPHLNQTTVKALLQELRNSDNKDESKC